MPPMNRDQIIQYIKSLEQKVKTFQTTLKDRDEEIERLKNELIAVIKNEGAPTLPVSSEPAIDEPKKTTFKPPLKVKPAGLDEDKPKSFVKPAAVGTDAKIKETVRTAQPNMEIKPPKDEEPPVPDEEEEPFEIPVEDADEEQPVIEAPAPFVPTINFQAGEFLNAVIEGEEEADEIKVSLARLAVAEPDKKRDVLMALTSTYWRMVDNMGKRLVRENLSWEKRLFLRYGMLDDKLMADRMDVWEQLYLDKSKPGDTGIYFMDEWLEAIARGELKYSTIDEFSLDGRKPDPNARGELALSYELKNIPQMQRMCVGARANQITILVQEYCTPGRDNPIVNRKWLPKAMEHVLNCDHTMFNRKYKGEDKVVQPYFIVCSGYGARSGCWEPWSPGQKGTTGPRLCISFLPPRSSMKTLLEGIADFRWEWAKADAMHYWLSEGLTGKWLALFSTKEQRKDLKQIFKEEYFHWVVNESRRIPKMDKKHRDFFWHNTPYSDKIKENLKGGGAFARMIELEEAKKKREEEERQELERIKAEREARKAARKAKLEGG